jgi:hypothetical protein
MTCSDGILGTHRAMRPRSCHDNWPYPPPASAFTVDAWRRAKIGGQETDLEDE